MSTTLTRTMSDGKRGSFAAIVTRINGSARVGIALLLFLAAAGKTLAFGGLTLFFEISGIAGNYVDTALALAIIALEVVVGCATLWRTSLIAPGNVFLWSAFAGYHIYRIINGTALPCPCLGTFWKVTAMSPIAPFILYSVFLATYFAAERWLDFHGYIESETSKSANFD